MSSSCWSAAAGRPCWCWDWRRTGCTSRRWRARSPACFTGSSPPGGRASSHRRGDGRRASRTTAPAAAAAVPTCPRPARFRLSRASWPSAGAWISAPKSTLTSRGRCSSTRVSDRAGRRRCLSHGEPGSGLTGRARLYPEQSGADPGLFLRGKEVVGEGDAEQGFTPLSPPQGPAWQAGSR